MYDPYSPPPGPHPTPYRNGSAVSPPVWPLEILLDMREDLGGLKAGMQTSLANDKEIFSRLRHLETGQARQPPPAPPQTTVEPSPRSMAGDTPTGIIPALTGLLTALRGLLQALPSPRELTALLLIWVVAIKGALAPETVVRLVELLIGQK